MEQMKNQGLPQVPQLKLTAVQIEKLAAFSQVEGQPEYTIAHGVIPSFEDSDGKQVPEYSGLIAYSQSDLHGVLQLD